MERYVSQEALARLEQTLPSLAGRAQMQAKLELAWHLRQRDSARALQLCQLLQQSEPLPSDLLVARCMLVQGEVKWLFGELDLALQLANIAVLIFEREQDAIGLADSYCLLGNIAHEQGQPALRHQSWQIAIEQAQQAGDALRLGAMQALLALSASHSDPQLARQQWQQRLRHDAPNLAPSLLACFQEFQGEIGIFGNMGAGLALLMQAFQGYLSHGNVQRAILVACHIGQHFCHINDFQNALEWQQRGLNLARESAWPGSIGLCLINMGECLRCLGRLEAAQQFMQEGLQHLGALPRSTHCAIGLIMFARLQLAQDDCQQALQTFLIQQHKAALLERYDLESDALLGMARAHLKLGDASAALDVAQQALKLA
ncbi:MAG: hypothetical protein HYZ45_14025, partial [Burkholderiales bacterium]|nr:hypothetical protein [Burkholderiales bacterium]